MGRRSWPKLKRFEAISRLQRGRCDSLTRRGFSAFGLSGPGVIYGQRRSCPSKFIEELAFGRALPTAVLRTVAPKPVVCRQPGSYTDEFGRFGCAGEGWIIFQRSERARDRRALDWCESYAQRERLHPSPAQSQPVAEAGPSRKGRNRRNRPSPGCDRCRHNCGSRRLENRRSRCSRKPSHSCKSRSAPR